MSILKHTKRCIFTNKYFIYEGKHLIVCLLRPILRETVANESFWKLTSRITQKLILLQRKLKK